MKRPRPTSSAPKSASLTQSVRSGHASGVAAELVVVEVVDDDVVGSGLALAQSARRLSAPAGEEIGAVFGGELAVGPVADGHLLAVVGNDALVVLELGLDVAQQSVGGVFAFSHDDHEIDEPPGLELEPQGQEDVEVCGLGVSARPLEHGLEVGRVLDQLGGGIVERRIVDDAQGLARDLVAQLQEVREVVFAEGGIVALEAAYALLLLGSALASQLRGVGDALHLPAVLVPLFYGSFEVCDGHVLQVVGDG